MIIKPPTGMPEPLGDEFSRISESVISLRVLLNTYHELFSHSGDRLGLLRQGTNGFFALVQQLMIKEMVIHFSKLTDEAKKGKFYNLSFYHIHDQVAFLQESDKSASLALIDELTSRLEGTRTARNKMIAHFDLTTAKAPVRIFEGLDYDTLSWAIHRCEEILNFFYKQYADSPLMLKEIADRFLVDGIIERLAKAAAYDLAEQRGQVPRDSWKALYIE